MARGEAAAHALECSELRTQLKDARARRDALEAQVAQCAEIEQQLRKVCVLYAHLMVCEGEGERGRGRGRGREGGREEERERERESTCVCVYIHV